MSSSLPVLWQAAAQPTSAKAPNSLLASSISKAKAILSSFSWEVHPSADSPGLSGSVGPLNNPMRSDAPAGDIPGEVPESATNRLSDPG